MFPFDRGKRKCNKTIKYQNRILEFGLSGTIPTPIPTNIALSNFKTAEEKLEEASNLAVLIDDFLYKLCELYRDYKENSPQFHAYLEEQKGALGTLTMLQATLISFKANPEGQQRNLDLAVKKMQKYFDHLSNFRGLNRS